MTTDITSLPTLLADVLPRYQYAFITETQLHDGLAAVLSRIGVPCQREFVAGPRDRFDFLLEGGVVIEAKIKGSYAAALRQVFRYCQRADVTAAVLVTTRFWSIADTRNQFTLAGKPVHVVRVGGHSF